MRDWNAEMRAVVDAETSGGPYVSRVVAEHVVAKLRATDPELLACWLESQAEHFLWQMIADRDRSTRAHARQSSAPRAFGEAAASGEPARLVPWLNVPFAVEDGSRKRLADMDQADLLYASNGYESRAHENLLTAAFLRAVAKKVGRRKVADVLTDAELSATWASLPDR